MNGSYAGISVSDPGRGPLPPRCPFCYQPMLLKKLDLNGFKIGEPWFNDFEFLPLTMNFTARFTCSCSGSLDNPKVEVPLVTWNAHLKPDYILAKQSKED